MKKKYFISQAKHHQKDLFSLNFLFATLHYDQKDSNSQITIKNRGCSLIHNTNKYHLGTVYKLTSSIFSENDFK